IQIQLSGSDMDVLQSLSLEVQALLAGTRGVVDIRDNLGALNPQIALQPDREAADFFGIPHGELAAQIRTAISNDVLGTFATGAATDDIDIRIGTEWPSRPGEARDRKSTRLNSSH